MGVFPEEGHFRLHTVVSAGEGASELPSCAGQHLIEVVEQGVGIHGMEVYFPRTAVAQSDLEK